MSEREEDYRSTSEYEPMVNKPVIAYFILAICFLSWWVMNPRKKPDPEPCITAVHVFQNNASWEVVHQEGVRCIPKSVWDKASASQK